MRAHDLHYWLVRHGWTWERTTGSHRHYRHHASGKRFHFAAHGRNPTLRKSQEVHIWKELERLKATNERAKGQS